MPISDVASLVGGAALGAPFSEIFKLLIAEAKKVTDFKPLSRDLASTMESLVPLFIAIDSMEDGSNPCEDELKVLIGRVVDLVSKCSRVQWYSVPKKTLYTRKIKGINQDLFRFCQIKLPLIHHMSQLKSMRSIATVSTKIDDIGQKFSELSIVPQLSLVPQPETVTIFWLIRPLMELKKKLFEDGVFTVVVSAPPSCGKTMLVTKLCHDVDVRGKFKHIFFITVSKSPNVRLIVQRLLEHTGCQSNEIANNLDASLCIQQLLKKLGQSGSILLVLDDVWPEEKSLLEKFLIKLPDYKILVTSRFEFPSFGPTFHLEPLIDEDVKNLFSECTQQQPNCQPCAKHVHNLQKILKPCNGLPLAMKPPRSMCGGCNSAIEHGIFVYFFGVLWHPECLWCDACHKPIAIHEVSNSRGKFHKSCYKKHRRRPNCFVCKEKIPFTAEGVTVFNMHTFWMEKYCPSHDFDGTPKCCSCERLVPWGTNYNMLCDGRSLCQECMESAVMDIVECHSLDFDIREFFEGLDMKIDQDFPLILVEKQVLNKAEEKKTVSTFLSLPHTHTCCNFQPKQDNQYEVVVRGICMSDEQTTVLGGQDSMPTDMETQSQTVIEVTGILILCGLPRLLTGYILAHEMMHAYLRLSGHRILNSVLEEGICQVLAHTWLESQRYAAIDAAASSSASSSRTPLAAASASKKGDCSDFEKKLAEFCKNQIEEDDSPIYGLGFKKVYEMVSNSSLQETLKEIIRRG